MKRLCRILPHVTIILAAMFLLFWVLDVLNPTMNFVNCQISNKLLLVFCVSAVATSVLAVVLERKQG